MVPLVFDEAGEADAPALASVFLGDTKIGLVTSAGWSYTLGRSVALAFVRIDLAGAGQALEVEVFGERLACRVAAEPLYDPENLRLRG
ncbi:MAG: hypothetical protein NT133_23160 [Alphaproteobacteria bacterium]|nr:hypothetical protein [Alphaproteobacteria bacterium]